MKKLILPALLVFGISLFSSCAKKNNPPANNGPTASMSASVAGKSWSAKSLTSIANSVAITITGTASDGSYMEITLPPGVTPGTYSLTTSGNYTYQYSTSVTSYLVTSGTLVVASYTKNSIMTGTFTAIANNGSSNISITNGSFTALF